MINFNKKEQNMHLLPHESELALGINPIIVGGIIALVLWAACASSAE